MGQFNDVFRFLCDEAFFVSGKEFALAWNELLRSEQSSIDESTVNRWKDDTLPRRFYLPKIIKLFAALNAERRASGEDGALGPSVSDRLLRFCDGGRASAGASRSELSKRRGDRAFLAGVLEAAYLSQKTARVGSGTAPGVPPRNGRRMRTILAALVAAGAAATIGIFIASALLSAPSAASPRRSEAASPAAGDLEAVDQDGLTPLMRAVANEDLAAARLLIAAGAAVNAPLYRGDRRKLEFLRRACEGTLSSFPVSGRLEDDVAAWGVYWGEVLPRFAFTPAVPPDGPAGDGRALRLSLLGGEPYAFAHFYLNLEPRRRAVRLTVGLRLFLDTEMKSNNAGGLSTVQALEVSVSKFDGKRRYELAWQWENVGEGAPQWRYWDPARGWIAAGRPQRLAPRTWHEIEFAGRAVGNAVVYDSLSIDGESFAVGKTAATAALAEPSDYLAAAVQLDGNLQSGPYDVYVKEFRLEATE